MIKEEDVLIIANAMYYDSVELHCYPNESDKLECKFCSNKERYTHDMSPDLGEMITDFEHESDCPVLVAQNILTGHS